MTLTEITRYMIGINDINPEKKTIRCDSFNIEYSNQCDSRYIYYDGILSASICDKTYHKTPSELLKKLEDSDEFVFLRSNDFSKNDLLDYYSACFKLDTIPYITKYGMIKEIDKDVLKDNAYRLSNEQFDQLAKNAFYQEENKKRREQDKTIKFNNKLVCNVLSIETKKGLYLLAYKELDLDIKERILKASNKVIINKEFSYDADTNDVKNVDSIYKFLPEESYYLLDDFENNLKEIIEIFHEYNDTRKSSYSSEIKIDESPYIINLGSRVVIDIDKELKGIKEMINFGDDTSLPIKTFFGDPDSKLSRRLNYPIFTVDNRFNIDQINSINMGMKSPVSYIQGPPGTGKTQTLLNAILTASFNGKTVLVTSNNNIPMDGVWDSIRKLKYKDEQLLFPAIRLGSFENCKIAIETIREMYTRAKKLNPKETKINNIKEERKNDMKKLVNLLATYDKLTNLKNKKNELEILSKNNPNDMFKIKIDAQIEKIKSDINNLGNVNIDEFESLMKKDDSYFYSFFMAIHFETAARLQKLNKPKFEELYRIIFSKATNDEEKDERAKKFRKYLENDENFKLFLEIFPVVISTNLSCNTLGYPRQQFDIVMMDEAGQCNVTNALIPIVRGKQLILVGDPQQLRPVILLDNTLNKELKNLYRIPNEYDYIDNSIYTVFTNVDCVNNETLLSFHYRCNEKIIQFSNKKYYNNRLNVKSNSKEKSPLVFVDTSLDDKKSLSNIRNISEIEAKFICEYVKNNPDLNIGIITPFVHQKECIQNLFDMNNIKNVSVGTVHAFQGDQKDVIIFSTAITKNTLKSTYNWLKNNKELINVAISRAKDKLIMLSNLSVIKELSNNSKDDLLELANYVNSDGESAVSNVSIPSYALGTRQMSTESEKSFSKTINQILSVLNNNCFIREQVNVSDLFNDDKVDASLFYKGKFDIVIYEKTYSGEYPICALELNGPEHYTDEEVIKRDNKKKNFCEIHKLILLEIPRDCARDYYNLKESLSLIVNVKKN